MAITFPATSATPFTDPNGVVWEWNGEAWRRFLGTSVVDVTDSAIATLVGDASSDARGALDVQYAKPARLSPVYNADKARTGQFRVAMIGMSIASFQPNLPALEQMLRNQYGDAGALYGDAGALGGSYTAPYLGWEKQVWFGPRFMRLRGKEASTSALRFVFEGDTLRLRFSTEADSEACNITIDGVTVGTTPAAGTQAFNVLSEFTVASGPHEFTIEKPTGAGFVYFESYESFESTRPGVITYDWTMGGYSLINTRIAGTATAPRLAAVALVDDLAGVDAHFDRDDIDLFVFMHDVNDAGNSFYPAQFTPAFNRMVELTRARPVPLVLVSSMGGHFSMPASPKFTQYAEIRQLYADTSATESHVSHIDWHAATVLEDIERYQQLYYPSVTDLNVGAGTHTGDFIHPASESGRALHHLFTDALHVPPARLLLPVTFKWDELRRAPLFGSAVTRTTDQLEYVCADFEFHDTTDTFTTPTAHGLSVGDKVIFYRSGAPTGSAAMAGFTPGFWWVVAAPTATTFQLSATDGGSPFEQAGSSLRSVAGAFIYRVVERTYRNPVEGGALQHYAHGPSANGPYIHVPIYRDDTITSIDMATRNSIAVSVTSDEWGRYHTPGSVQNVTVRDVACGQTFTDGKGCVMLFRFKGLVGIRALDSTSTKIITPDGQDCKLTTVSSGRYEATIQNLADEPIVMAVHMFGSSVTATVGIVPAANTRIYEAATVYGTVPVWPGDG